ncbi:MAG TPA: outer membrane beta-barrel protein [Gemmataceae bacterium]|jgi:hypothetical protein|nr:outer membrane beta-barrel protein [Gemmataceae bacterium]
MFDVFCLGVALAVGQGSPAPMPPTITGQATVTQGLPARIPAALPTVGVPGVPVVQKKDAPGEAKVEEPKKEEEKKEDEKKPEEKGHFMKMLEGTDLGCKLEACKIKIDGWAAMSYTCSNRNGATNLPVTWNDRADSFLFQQFWVNIEKGLDKDSKEVNSGWKVAFLYGSDYRFTLIRGFLNNQLMNPRFDIREPNRFEQNIYGLDIPLFYANAWLPGVGGEGTEVAIGRMFTPFGTESVMAPSTPLMSRSYAFQWAPPFFHTGVMADTKVDKNLSVKNMIVNGNDVFFDGSQEWRYVGAYTLTSDDEKTTMVFGTSLGRGKFNAARPNGPAQGVTTLGLAYEPVGRNNFNVFDLTVAQKVDDNFSVGFEAIYGYQQCVPAAATGNALNFGGTAGTAHWLSLVKYLNYNFSDQVSGVARAEAFYDAEGSRTGFEGWYYAGTLGLQIKPMDSVIFRPEIRYDYNGYSRPFNGYHSLFTAGADLIIKF